jgi:hypothetical protein
MTVLRVVSLWLRNTINGGAAMLGRQVVGAVVVAVFASSHCVLADEVFEPPTRLEADGKPIDTGEAWGHSSPCVEDVDGDGLRDLVLGDFGGKFHLYKNVGEKDAPVYKSAGNLQADGTDASVRIYCCIGSQARFCDLDNDGVRDFISNSYDPGHCYYFRGLGAGKFAKSEEVVDKAGVPVRSTPDQKQNVQSFGSFYAPVDWDADGDQDMLIGCFGGGLKLRMNEGDAAKYAFAAENIEVHAGDKPLNVAAHCCPIVADWDGDGLWDLLAGSDDGSVTWFQNTGTKTSPQFAEGETLVEKHDGNGYDLMRWDESDITPGIRSQIEVVDHNGDGKLDLLLGDFCTVFDTRTLDEAEREQFEKLVNELRDSGKPFADKMKAMRDDFKNRYPGEAIHSDEASAEWSAAYKALQESPEAKQMESEEVRLVKEIRPYLADTRDTGDRSFDLAKSHGYVWLYIRK